MSPVPRLVAARHIVVSCVEYPGDRKSTRLNSSHDQISYAVFCLKKKKKKILKPAPRKRTTHKTPPQQNYDKSMYVEVVSQSTRNARSQCAYSEMHGCEYRDCRP